MTTSTGYNEADAIGLATDERYRLLAAEHRRVALDVLAERGESVSLRDLASAVASRASETPDDREELLIALHHTHLPLLAEHGVVEYDAETKRIEPVRDRVTQLTA